jgi:prepilin-type N-terminal cleavage/methylation domain-containing protein
VGQVSNLPFKATVIDSPVPRANIERSSHPHPAAVRQTSPTTGRRRRRGFTLVELLIVVVIISMLAAMTIVALARASEFARENKTKATIAKISNIILPMYEDYKYRRVPINTTSPDRRVVALQRLVALRDLMRMEMPDRKSDIANLPISGITPPSLQLAYQARAANMGKNAPAECLYLIVTLAGGEDARKQFHDDEVADTDGNGLMEFVDGWGRPIWFMRWAPGFNESDLQPNIPGPDDVPLATRNQIMLDFAEKDHDPFDTRRIDMMDPKNANDYPRGWRLVPLIYSGGADGVPGLAEDFDPASYVWNMDTYSQKDVNGVKYLWGQPLAAGKHNDNIHNHRLEVQ